MPKVVARSFKQENARSGRNRRTAPRTLRVVKNGKTVTLTEVDLDSDQAGYDLLTAFRRAVRNARLENKRLLGSTEG